MLKTAVVCGAAGRVHCEPSRETRLRDIGSEVLILRHLNSQRALQTILRFSICANRTTVFGHLGCRVSDRTRFINSTQILRNGIYS